MKLISETLTVIILAAGKGTRMKSNLPKVLHEIAGRKMIELVIDTAKKLNPEQLVVVVSEEMLELVSQIQNDYADLKIKFAVQKERLGTAHAVETALNSLQKISDIVLVLYADTPLLSLASLNSMIEVLSSCDQSDKIKANHDQPVICILGFDCTVNNPEENKYGRLLVSGDKLEKIIEFKDASFQERKISLSNSGVMAVHGSQVKDLLLKVDNKNAASEYYLTDIIAIANAKKLTCCFLKVAETEVMGVNSRADLAKAEKIKQDQIRDEMMNRGVTLIDPASVYFSYDTEIKADVIINPNVFFGKGVIVESGVEIKSFSHIEGAHIMSGVVIGPFARIRPKTIIEAKAKIGNFVEVKNSKIESRAKINHLSYIGDSEIGYDSNIGAGTITCNYDGYQKFKTKIGKKVLVGSNSALVAPVVIGDNAVIAAGSVITKDVASDELAVSRAKQINLKEGGKKYHQKRK